MDNDFWSLVKSLGRRWASFLGIVFDPWFLVLFCASIIFIWLASKQRDALMIAVLSLIISLLAAALGAILMKKWADLTEEKVIVARGKSAVRSLKLLLGNISALYKRARECCDRLQDRDSATPLALELMRSHLEEVVGRCGVLEEETLSSIENWMDVIPEADVKTQIGVISTLRAEAAQLSEELKAQKDELADMRDRSEASEAAMVLLKRDIKNKEEALSKAQRELTDATAKYGPIAGTSGYASITFPAPSYITALGRGGIKSVVTCRSCGKGFETEKTLLTTGGLCPDCARKSEGSTTG